MVQVLFHKGSVISQKDHGVFPERSKCCSRKVYMLFQIGPKYCSKQFLKVLFQKTLKVLSHNDHKSAVPEKSLKVLFQKTLKVIF